MRGENNPSWREDREQFELEKKLRKKFYKALQSTLAATGKKKVGRTSDMLGYGPKELKNHVTNHPNWNRVKCENWHLDHIFPISAFIEHGVTDPAIVNHLDNLQPVTQKENNQKWATYDKKAFEKWLIEHEIF